MKKLFLLLCLISCGKESGSGPRRSPPSIETPPTEVQNLWRNDNQASVLASLDLRAMSLNGVQPSSNIINCDGSLGNSGSILGAAENEILVEGSAFEGTIQAGNLSYVGSSNYAACRAMSKEKYEYTVIGSSLILKNIGYCASHACQNDGVEVFQLDEAQL